ncbi:cell volume regulation protein A [Bacillus pakistanensis]|uniref:Cell volume regulation protein A n=1 Tax=Rossellomorea pakistanensis TaxID=992288 RepID=A0ABS2NEW9_9BACI|nr:potassium/proton antiporter [Bacillus pakistanensis]MBM7586360.1 cell volume regulation protein A [Bacillus pakistanensis]
MLLHHFDTDYIILLLSTLLILGVITTKFSTRLGVPSLVLFIMLGMIMGSDILDIIYFDNPNIAQLIGVLALIVILFEGGLQTKWSSIKKVAYPSLSLATLGVLLTTTIVALAAKYILGMDWLVAFLLGSIVGSTDAAAVFAALSGKNVKQKLASTLEAESGTNDPMAVFLTLSFIQLITMEESNVALLIGSFFWQMGIGLVIGFILGKIGSNSINKISLDSSGLYPVFALAFAILTYGLTAMVNASGLLAVYVAALVIGNKELTYRHSILRFNEGFAWMMQILMFVILGLLVFPSQLWDWTLIWKGFLVAFILIFIARPIAVYLSLTFFKFTNKEKLFIAWAGLRGAVPIVLATFPMISNVENSQVIFNYVFFIVLSSALIQGSSIVYLANKLKLTGPNKTTPPHTLELVSIGKANAEMIEYHVEEANQLIGQTMKNLELPKNVLVNAIIRNEALITPSGETSILKGDILYILSDKKSVKELKHKLNEYVDRSIAH